MKNKADYSLGRRAKAAALAILLLAASFAAASCSDPVIVVLGFSPGSAPPTLTANSASIAYTWSFTDVTSLGDSGGLPVLARLYLENVTAGRILAAEATFELTAMSGSGTCDFTIATALVHGTYYVEFAFADDLGPRVVESVRGTL